MNKIAIVLLAGLALPLASSQAEDRAGSRRDNFLRLNPTAITDNFPPSNKLVIPGKADQSMLYKVLVGGGFVPRMPPFGGPFPADKAAQVKAWIDAGAKQDAFDKTVGPMLKASCSGCHSAAHATAGIGLDSFDALVKSANGQLHNNGPHMM